MKKLLCLLFLIVIQINSYSQTYNIGSQALINSCSGNLYDNGGPNSGYNDNGGDSQIVIICSDDSVNTSIQLNYTQFLLGGADTINIYDGDSTSAPLLGSFLNTNTPGIIAASPANISGCLTVEFVPDGNLSPLPGFTAEISCFEPCQNITPSISSIIPSEFENDVYTVYVFENINFNANVIFENTSFNANYNWDFGDGNTASGLSVSHTFNQLGIYNVELEVVDVNGCAVLLTVPVEVIFYQEDGDCVITTMNYDFEEPIVPSIATFLNHANVPGWFTTATDSQMEFWVTTNAAGGIPAYSGNQYIELNANQASGVYQDYDTPIAGTQFYFSFAHAARNQTSSGQDIVGVYAGAPGSNLSLVAQYSTAINAGWEVKVGTYTVPANQATTRFEFRAISTASGDNTVGNFLDAIQFTANLGILTQPQTVSCISEVTLEAVGSGQWIADDANNPSPATIENPNSPTTNISGLNGIGVYTFTWTNQYCEESVTVEVVEGNITLITDIIEILGQCDSDGNDIEVFDLTQIESQFVDVPSQYNILYFNTEGQAETGDVTQAINDPQNFTFVNNIISTIYIRIEDEECFRIGEITGTNFTQPVITDIDSYEECFFSLSEASFDLGDNTALVLGNQNEDLFEVTYHGTLAEAENNDVTPLPETDYEPSSLIETIYVRIENTLNPDCYVVEEFTLTVNTITIGNTLTDIEECDEDNDGDGIFDLTENEDLALDGQ
ncbi:PKD domain-containing protein, partial [Mesonia algae]